jgi:NAD(P)H-flavin reductase
VICISRENGNGEFVHGRVTEQVEALHDTVRETDFYVSGNPGMTAEVTRILRRKGATAIFTESY